MVLDGLGYGGIERVGASYAKILEDLGNHITIINLQPDKNAMKDKYPKSCEFINTRLPNALLCESYFGVIKRYWWGKYLYPFAYITSKICMQLYKLKFKIVNRGKKYDIAIAFAGHTRDLSFIGYEFIKSQKKIAWLHGSLADYLLLSHSFAFLYERIANLCVLSTNNQIYSLKAFPKLASCTSITKIYNPIPQTPQDIDQCKIDHIRAQYKNPLIMVARFDEDKDQATLIYALKLLHDKYNNNKHLLLLGEGPTLNKCKQLAASLNLIDYIHFLGAKDDVDNYFQASSISILSSPAEGLPTVLIESMRNGVPVVATNSLPGVPEILGSSEYGLICEIRNPDDIAEKINELLSNQYLYDTLVTNGYKRVQDFSIDVIKKKLKVVLNNLV